MLASLGAPASLRHGFNRYSCNAQNQRSIQTLFGRTSARVSHKRSKDEAATPAPFRRTRAAATSKALGVAHADGAVDRFLETLNEEQRAAVLSTAHAVRIKAGPGSGKTRVVTGRVAHLLAQGSRPSQLCVITFTNKAAQELKLRIADVIDSREASLIAAGTFHSTCCRILRSHVSKLECGLTSRFAVKDTDDSRVLLRRIISGDREEGAAEARGSSEKAVWYHSAICDVSNQLPTTFGVDRLTALRAHARLDTGVKLKDLPDVADVWTQYVQRKGAANAVDYDDILSLTVALLQRHPDVLADLRDRWRHVLVDEFQDTNAAQYELVRLLAGHADGNVFVVGDPDQAIYGWRGADSDNMDVSFQRDWPDFHSLCMTCNYRSQPHILRAAETLIGYSGLRQAHPMRCMRDASMRLQLQVTAVRVNDLDAEAVHVTELVQRQHQIHGIPYKDMAVLYRTNAQSRPFEESFLKAGVPHVIVGGTEFWKRAEVKVCLAYLSLALNPTSDEIGLDRIAAEPPRGLGDSTLSKLTELGKDRGVTLPGLLFEGCEAKAWLGADVTRAAMDAALQEGADLADWVTLVACPELVFQGTAVKLTKKTRAGLEGLRALVVLLRNAARHYPVHIVMRLALVASGYRTHLKQGRGSQGTLKKDKFEIAAGRLLNLDRLTGLAEEKHSWADLDETLGVPDEKGYHRPREGDGDGHSPVCVAVAVKDWEDKEAQGPPRDDAGLTELSSFCTYVKLFRESSSSSEEGRNGVTVSTLHAAKGREWPVVIIAGCVAGVLPMLRPNGESPSDMAEENRLAYVGVTRAKDALYLFHPAFMALYGTVKACRPSPYLKLLGSSLKSEDKTSSHLAALKAKAKQQAWRESAR